MSTKNMNPAVAAANREYFLALAHTRASLDRLALMAIVMIFLLAVANVGPLSLPSGYEDYEVLSSIASVNLVLIVASAIFLLASLFKKLVYRFQVFFSGVMAAMAVGWLYAICLLFLAVATLTQARDGLDATLFSVGGWVTVALVICATLVHLSLLRRRLRAGYSEKRTAGNFLAVSGSNTSKTFWVTFGVVAVVPNVVTQGQYLINILGALSLVFLALVMTSLPVEFGYLAYLKSKDRGYWEKLPRLTAKQRQRLKKERQRTAKKAGLWVFGIVAALTLFWALAKFLPIWLG